MPVRTPPTTRPDAVLQRRIRALVRALKGAERGEPRAIHKARVATRRVREAVPVSLASSSAKKRRGLRARVARLTKALGPIRELDVTLGLIDELAEAEPSLVGALHPLRNELEHERRIEYARMRARLDAVDVRKVETRTRRLLERERDEADEVQARAALVVRLARRVEALDAAIDAAGPLYSPEAIHAVRIAAKKLRYVFELAQELRLLGSRGVLPRLRNVQETLGRLHDLQMLHARVDAARASADATRRTGALDELNAFLEERSRQLHARFVARRDSLRAAIDSALAETASRAADTPPARAHRPTVH